MDKSHGGVAAQAAPKSDRYWDDEEFQDQLTYLLVNDGDALEQCKEAGLGPNELKPVDGMRNGMARWVVGERALEHYEKHGEPIGKLLRADVLRYANYLSLGATRIGGLHTYCDLLGKLKPAASASITEKVGEFMCQRRKAAALDEMIDLQAVGQLTDDKWRQLTERALIDKSASSDAVTTQAQAPEPLKPEALYGLAGDIVKTLKPCSEADPAALLLQTLAAFGNVVGTGPYWIHAATRHALNLFVGIIGDTGRGKGTGLDMVMDVFHDVDLPWSSNPNTYAGLASGEGFIYMVRDPKCRKKNGELVVDDEGVEDKRLLLLQPEFAQVLEVCDRTGNTLATKLRNAWDGKPLSNNSLTSPLTATGAHISLIVHSTKVEMQDLMRRTMILNGFGNRFLWVWPAPPSNFLPFGRTIPSTKRAALVERLREAVEFAKGLKKAGKGRMFFEKPAASNLWVSAYKTVLTRDSESPLTGRAFAQTRRLATVYALMDCSPQVRVEHLQAALETWRYCADSARFIFGGVHKEDPMADKLLEALRESGKQGLTRKEIYNLVFQGNKSSEEITRVLQSLQKQGRARMRIAPPGAKGGRPAERWFAA